MEHSIDHCYGKHICRMREFLTISLLSGSSATPWRKHATELAHSSKSPYTLPSLRVKLLVLATMTHTTHAKPSANDLSLSSRSLMKGT